MTPREAELTTLLEQCRTALAQSLRENQLLREKINLLVRRVFGSSSETLDPAQLQLLLSPSLEATEPAPAPQVAPASTPTVRLARKTRSTRLPENLPVVEEVVDPEPVKAEPQQWRCIGQEVSEQLDYEPGRFLRRRLVRRKYVHRSDPDRAPVIAPLPLSLQERCLASPALMAHVAVTKYCDHVPLYRLEQILARRYGIHLPRQTLGRWIELMADWLKPIYEHIRTGVMGGGYVQLDETPINYLEPGAGRALQGYLWTGNRPGGDVFFQWHTSRAAACLDTIVPVDFTGTIQCDGYAAYRAFAKGRSKPLTLAGCWAHARRKFYEAQETAPRTAGWVLRQIQHLYRIEAELRRVKAGPNLRAAVRASQSRPIVQRLKRACERLLAVRRFLPQSAMGTAIDYALGQMPGLEVYLQDGRIEIDNNLVENAIRPTAVGKKNWLFVGEAGAGERSAILYTIIESCRRRNVDPYAYLKDVLSRLPSMTNHQIPEVTPAAWAMAHTKPLRQLAS
ncbi:MAG TPA: IS66 family transposase [Verrucomicrobiota bacterium]|jgi:transposase|nr:IS66 family transposase [Verrucomicrobiota bacterium]